MRWQEVLAGWRLEFQSVPVRYVWAPSDRGSRLFVFLRSSGEPLLASIPVGLA